MVYKKGDLSTSNFFLLPCRDSKFLQIIFLFSKKYITTYQALYLIPFIKRSQYSSFLRLSINFIFFRSIASELFIYFLFFISSYAQSFFNSIAYINASLLIFLEIINYFLNLINSILRFSP